MKEFKKLVPQIKEVSDAIENCTGVNHPIAAALVHIRKWGKFTKFQNWFNVNITNKIC